jgi:hypothetical protein
MSHGWCPKATYARCRASTLHHDLLTRGGSQMPARGRAMNIRMIATSAVVASAMATAMVAPSATAATSDGTRGSSQPASSNASATTRAGIDIKWVTHRFVGEGATFLRVVVKQKNITKGTGLRIYIDARGKDPGPEFVVEGFSGSEWTLRHAETWKKFGPDITCPSSRFSIDTSKSRSTLRLLRSCLNNHTRFRLAVRATHGSAVDWWPRFHKFGNWFSI